MKPQISGVFRALTEISVKSSSGNFKTTTLANRLTAFNHFNKIAVSFNPSPHYLELISTFPAFARPQSLTFLAFARPKVAFEYTL